MNGEGSLDFFLLVILYCFFLLCAFLYFVLVCILYFFVFYAFLYLLLFCILYFFVFCATGDRWAKKVAWGILIDGQTSLDPEYTSDEFLINQFLFGGKSLSLNQSLIIWSWQCQNLLVQCCEPLSQRGVECDTSGFLHSLTWSSWAQHCFSIFPQFIINGNTVIAKTTNLCAQCMACTCQRTMHTAHSRSLEGEIWGVKFQLCSSPLHSNSHWRTFMSTTQGSVERRLTKYQIWQFY